MNLEQCREELRGIIGELRSIGQGVRGDFAGVGQEMCANGVDAIAGHYQNRVQNRLDNVNYNRLAGWMVAQLERERAAREAAAASAGRRR